MVPSEYDTGITSLNPLFDKSPGPEKHEWKKIQTVSDIRAMDEAKTKDKDLKSNESGYMRK